VDKEQLKYVLSEAEERRLPSLFARDVPVPVDTGKAVILTGIRRSGKTSMLFGAMLELAGSGVSRESIVYLNLEDDRLYPATAPELDLIVRAHDEMHPSRIAGRRYLFLDEVQAVPGWERFVRRLLDSGQWGVFLTGSSSRLLRKNIAAPMRGRSLPIEVQPLNFREFLRFRGVDVKPHSRASEARIHGMCAEYLQTGGFPEVVLAEAEWRGAILQEYADLILYKDLIEGFGIANTTVLKLLLKHCLGHPGGLFSPHKFHTFLKSQGIAVSKDTVYAYLDHLEEAFVLYPVRKWARSLRTQTMNPVKLFSVDNGLSGRFSASPDRGKKLENAVFQKLKSGGQEIFYLANGHEVDLATAGESPEHAWNVTWSLGDPSTRERELQALTWAARTYPGLACRLIAHETPSAWKAPFPLIPASQFLLE